ncbi:MAG TPA: molybdenum cofactor biosynthesis protein MoaE [Candidatus Kapabacteria bacterium]|nr:molybdenum cofactor biosynthesis protein MoaE [Candidatus Kapabacteria bacterium]
MPARDNIYCAISPEPLSTDTVQRFVTDESAGAVAVFSGTARTVSSITPGRIVLQLEYEAYEEMAMRVLQEIGESVIAAHQIKKIALVHRTGVVPVGEISLIAAVSAQHRAPAFEGLRDAVEQIKKKLPVWKKEVYSDGSHWVGAGS